MRLLLDTHVLIQLLTEPERVKPELIRVLTAGTNSIAVSVASMWEIAIKRSLGKLELPGDLKQQLHEKRIDVLNITAAHALGIEELPAIHRDPFDRMLVAQAQIEGMTIVTGDRRIHEYKVAVFRA